MQQAFVNIKGLPVNVCTWGRWISEKPKTSEPEDIILVIPGNPGVIGFYDEFMRTLHEEHGCPVWAIGHTAHEEPKGTINPLLSDPVKYGLQEQVKYKADFIKQCIPENARLHLIGHSIGAYMILELLKDEEIKRRVAKSYLLFPVFERMSETRHGKMFLNYLKYVIWFIIMMARLFVSLPKVISAFLLYIYMLSTGLSKRFNKPILDLVQPEILRRVFFLAFDELAELKARNDTIIKENQEKLALLYGENDGWVPLQFCEDFRKDYPSIDVKTTRFDHSFVLKNSVEIANIVSKWIKKAP